MSEHDDYADYLERMAAFYPHDKPLSREQFENARREWNEKYDALWDAEQAVAGSGWPEIQKLERLLAL